MPDTFEKPVSDKLDYTIDWSDYCDKYADTIVSSDWSASPATGIVLSNGSNTPKTTKIWAESGTLMQKYKLFNTITTAGGRIATRYITVEIKKEIGNA